MHPAAHLLLLQYEFKLQPAKCLPGKSCAPLTFFSNTPNADFPGLTPNTTVSWCQCAKAS